MAMLSLHYQPSCLLWAFSGGLLRLMAGNCLLGEGGWGNLEFLPLIHNSDLFSPQPQVHATTGAFYLLPQQEDYPVSVLIPLLLHPCALPGGGWGVGIGWGREDTHFSSLVPCSHYYRKRF